MTSKINIQTYINGFISMTRNVYLTSSVSIALFGFSKVFKEYKKLIQIIAFIIIGYSIVLGIVAANNLNQYINYAYKNKKNTELDYLLLKHAKIRIYLLYFFICILIIIAIIVYLSNHIL